MDMIQNTPVLSGLYVITDTNLMDQQDIVEKVSLALEGGAKIVQFRDKINSSQTKLMLAKKLRHLCTETDALFIINDDIDLAKTVAADGVHIGKEDRDIEVARKTLGNQAIIGVSCYNDIARAQEMQEKGANYVAFGRFFSSQTKPSAPPADLETLAIAKQSLNIPIVAIGGVDESNAQSLITAGADSVAVIQGVFAQKDIKKAALKIQAKFEA